MQEKMQELSMDEIESVSGGWVAIAAAATVALIGFGMGVYNGYQSAAAAK